MALLPDINEKQTTENVRNFFNKVFPRLQNMAHISYVEIQSPIITGMPIGAKTDNSNEDKLTTKSILDDFLRACKTMPYSYRDIMELKYFKGLSWFEITERLGYSTRRGHELINDAFLQFAYAFADTEDFRVFLSIYLHLIYSAQHNKYIYKGARYIRNNKKCRRNNSCDCINTSNVDTKLQLNHRVKQEK
ncbi:hypothetical protein IE337_04080 [Weissella viridescens]|uniref:ArpU family phage packaging/lysis transcriptional regulator n=1 Tax=Weissella viridescens TaxID=1629 RepID=UPI001747AAAE|nr:ArpU family phage packaging/lysis transcriptional regulator [Weissella viridescens]QOD85392.1 hypothetical protein IE337_04080 [Weissella viridescens]WJI90495.1 hypothetical protein PWA48_04055 [Weissella viridescens]